MAPEEFRPQCAMHESTQSRMAEALQEVRKAVADFAEIKTYVALMRQAADQASAAHKKDLDSAHDAIRANTAELRALTERISRLVRIERLDEVDAQLLHMEKRLIHIEQLAEQRAPLSERVSNLEKMASEARGTIRGVQWLWAILVAGAGALGAYLHAIMKR